MSFSVTLFLDGWGFFYFSARDSVNVFWAPPIGPSSTVFHIEQSSMRFRFWQEFDQTDNIQPHTGMIEFFSSLFFFETSFALWSIRLCFFNSFIFAFVFVFFSFCRFFLFVVHIFHFIFFFIILLILNSVRWFFHFSFIKRNSLQTGLGPVSCLPYSLFMWSYLKQHETITQIQMRDLIIL